MRHRRTTKRKSSNNTLNNVLSVVLLGLLMAKEMASEYLRYKYANYQTDSQEPETEPTTIVINEEY